MFLYEIQVKSIKNKAIFMSEYAGKVLLIVNVASKCGFTSQYQGLERLYQKYQKKGFFVLGFPCNQFGGQEPGNEEEIQNFCQTQYQVTFPLFEKISVNGPKTHPLFKFLKASAKGILATEAVKWNFTKFLVDREGKIVRRFSPQTTPEQLDSKIEELLR